MKEVKIREIPMSYEIDISYLLMKKSKIRLAGSPKSNPIDTYKGLIIKTPKLT